MHLTTLIYIQIFEWLKHNSNHFDLTASIRQDLKYDTMKQNLFANMKHEFNSHKMRNFCHEIRKFVQ